MSSFNKQQFKSGTNIPNKDFHKQFRAELNAH